MNVVDIIFIVIFAVAGGFAFNVLANAGGGHPSRGRLMSVDVVVVGAGVSGLTTAVRLLEAGASVSVRTAARHGNHLCRGRRDDRPGSGCGRRGATRGSSVSDRAFRTLAGQPGAGVAVRRVDC